MKNELKMGIACGTILVAGFAAQIGMTQHESKQIAQQIQNQTHILTQQARMVQQEMRASRAEATQMAVAIKSAQRPPITEDFKITSVDDNGWVHGEKTEGTGEGIYYHEDLFVHFIGSKVQAGDEVAISWPAESYNNDEWNDIATIERIEK